MTDARHLRGHWPALLTPITADGQPDTDRLLAHGERLLDAGSDGLTLLGTSGEGTAFSVAQRRSLVDHLVGHGVPASRLIVNLTALALEDAMELGRHAVHHVVAGAQLMAPYGFDSAPDAGNVEAVSQVVRGVASDDLRLLLDHCPSACHLPFSHAAVAELVRRHPTQIAGVKDSSADLDHALGLVEAFPQLAILIGSEAHVAPAVRAGAAGSINALANIAPRLMQRLVDQPHSVAAADDARLQGLLALLPARSGMPFVSLLKTMLAEQSGDDGWLNVCAPLERLDPDEARAVRDGYRAAASDPGTL